MVTSFISLVLFLLLPVGQRGITSQGRARILSRSDAAC
jgi:hypothetical protein